MADLLLLRVCLAGTAVVSEDAAVADSVAAASAFLLFFWLFFDPASLVAVEVSELAVAASAEASFLLFLWDFFDPVSLAAAEISELPAAVSAEAAFLLFLLDFFAFVSLAVAVSVDSAFLLFFDFLAEVAEVSVEAAESVDALVFAFFFLVVVVEVWSSAELAAWGLAKALIPDITNNTQSTVTHVLSLVCSLVMISLSRFRLALNNFGSSPPGRLGHFPARLRGDHNDTSTDRGQPWKNRPGPAGN